MRKLEVTAESMHHTRTDPGAPCRSVTAWWLVESRQRQRKIVLALVPVCRVRARLIPRLPLRYQRDLRSTLLTDADPRAGTGLQAAAFG